MLADRHSGNRGHVKYPPIRLRPVADDDMGTFLAFANAMGEEIAKRVMRLD